MSDSNTRSQDLSALRLDRSQASSRATRRRWPWIVVAVVGVAIAGTALVRSKPTEVTLTRAVAEAPGDVPLLSGSGYVVTAERYVSIGVRVAGRIDRYFVEEGQRVRKGDALVQLDDRDYRAIVARIEAGLKLARANSDLAKAELRRGQALRQTGVASVAELDVLTNKALVAEATISQLEAELQQARVNLDYTTLRAPTDGVILAKLKEVGEIAVPGGFQGSGDLIRIANLNEMRAEVDINESDLARIKLGQPAVVIPDSFPDLRYKATVAKLYPQVDRQKGTLKVEVRITEPDAKLLPDMSARISFLRDAQTQQAEKSALLVPVESVHRDGEGYFVWRVENGTAERAAVEPGGSAGGRMRITTGLTETDDVVANGIELRAGQSVVAGGGAK